MLSFCILDVHVVVHCSDMELQSLMLGIWGPLVTPSSKPVIAYTVARAARAETIVITRQRETPLESRDAGEFLYQLEHDLTIELQKRRAELYFLHAAAVELEGKAALLVAASGGGKSTTTWGLLHHGFGYLSDELAPLDLMTMRVHAYPRALCLKRQPPSSYPLPQNVLTTTHTLHVPIQTTGGGDGETSYPLSAVFFLDYRPQADAPCLQTTTVAGAAARLYANALNQLAHANSGLDAAARIAESVPCYVLESADLRATCELVGRKLQTVPST